MIYFLDTKTLVETFTKEHTRKEILDTEFVIVSTRIHSKVEKNIFNSELYQEKLIFSLDGDDSNRDYEIVKRGLMDNERVVKFLIKLMTFVLVEKRTVVLLCSPNEMKTGYLRLVSKVIENTFSYPVIDYKKEREKTFYYDPVVVAKKIKATEKYLLAHLLEDESNRKEAVKLMTKKEMKKELKKLDLYHKDMTKSDMKDMLQTFFVERDD